MSNIIRSHMYMSQAITRAELQERENASSVGRGRPWEATLSNGVTCTPDPTARPKHASCIFASSPAHFFRVARKAGWRLDRDISRHIDEELAIYSTGRERRGDDDALSKIIYVDWDVYKYAGEIQFHMRGGIRGLSVEFSDGGPQYGIEELENPIASAVAKSPHAYRFLESLAAERVGTACFLSHAELVRPVMASASDITLLRMRCVTGMGPDDAPDSWPKSLGTVLELIDPAASAYEVPEGCVAEENQTERPSVSGHVVARALIGYRDIEGPIRASDSGLLHAHETELERWFPPSVGPTVQYITVRRDYYGCRLAQILVDEIEKWFVETWTLDAWKIDETNERGNREKARMLKATQLSSSVVDQVPQPSSGEQGRLITDKILLFKHNGFSANVPTAYFPDLSMREMYIDCPHGRAHDQEAVRWYPPAGTAVQLPTRGGSKLRGLMACLKPEQNLNQFMKCKRCMSSRYCNRTCQKSAWKIHRLHCMETVETVQKKMGDPEQGSVRVISSEEIPQEGNLSFLVGGSKIGGLLDSPEFTRQS